jgi:hypothetical protein
MRFELDRRRVVHETIDGEVILIHMETGFYYSLEGSGSEIWDALVAGGATDEIARRLRARYVAPPGDIEDAVSAIAEELREERLLDRAPEPSTNGATEGNPSTQNGGAAPLEEFVPPLLHRYTDMADFMLVDPIHEVEDAGWPNRKVAP